MGNALPISEVSKSHMGEENLTPEIKGRRIVDLGHIVESIKRISKHPPFDCSFSDMEFTKEVRTGLSSVLHFKCKNCNIEEQIKTENPTENEHYMNVNTAAVSGAMATGVGFSQMREIFAVLDTPFMSQSTWSNRQEQVCSIHLIKN